MHSQAQMLEDLKRYRSVSFSTFVDKPKRALENANNGETQVIMNNDRPLAMLVNTFDYLNLVRQLNDLLESKQDSVTKPKPKRSRKTKS